MTFKRNVDADRLRTNEILELPADERAKEANHRPNWLGHGGEGNAAIDALLLEGATLDELEKHRHARSHLTHLRREHGLVIDRRDSFYIFSIASVDDATEESQSHSDAIENVFDEQIAKNNHINRLPDHFAPEVGSERSFGLVYLTNHDGRVAKSLILRTEEAALEKLGNEDVVFYISCPGRDALLAVVDCIRDVWNHWVIGKVDLGPPSSTPNPDFPDFCHPDLNKIKHLQMIL